MEYSVGEDSDKEEEGLKTPTNKPKSSTGMINFLQLLLMFHNTIMKIIEKNTYDGLKLRQD